jgi:methionyl-tRNA formyltransferase
MSLVGANVLSKTLKALEEGTITPKKQPEEGVTYAPIITKQMGQLDFSKSARELDCLIRGFTPWPLAYFYLDGRRYKIYGAKIGAQTDKAKGTVYTENGKAFVACADGISIEITEICPDGSKRMDSAAFINGRFIESGSTIDFIQE